MKLERVENDRAKPVKHPRSAGEQKRQTGGSEHALTSLQRRVGNRAVQRMLAQRQAAGPTELDEDTVSRINRERSGGQPLDQSAGERMTNATGQDFSQVKVHTSPKSAALNQELGAKAFTTGNDVFFNEGAYQPNNSGGQELIAHELTHVVQQSTGAASSSGSGMTVNAPGDVFEQEADRVSQAVTRMDGSSSQGVQRETQEEEEEPVQMQELDDDELLQGKG